MRTITYNSRALRFETYNQVKALFALHQTFLMRTSPTSSAKLCDVSFL